MSNWAKFWRLSAEERRLFLAAVALLALFRLGLAIFGLKRLQAILRRTLPAQLTRNAAVESRQASRTARLVAVAGRYVGGTCLVRSLVLAWLLERRRIPAELRIGVRKGEQGLEAHAWVEVAGVALNDGLDVGERFAAFDQSFALARGIWR